MLLLRLARTRPRTLALVATLLLVRYACHPATAGVCANMSATECLGAAAVVIGGSCMLAFVSRATWLAIASAWSVGRLPRAETGAELAASVGRTGVPAVTCLAGEGHSAFCAGMLRPRLYVTQRLARALLPEELDAVLLHEATHARWHDPLRRLLARAASDVFFFLPLVSWWTERQYDHAELRADRVAMAGVGGAALAGALLSAGVTPYPAAATPFGGTTEQRVAQLLGDEVPAHRPRLLDVGLSFAGLAAAVSLFMCVGQALIIRL